MTRQILRTSERIASTVQKSRFAKVTASYGRYAHVKEGQAVNIRNPSLCLVATVWA